MINLFPGMRSRCWSRPSLRLPPSATRRKADFTCALPGQPPLPPESLNRLENEPCHRLTFRLIPPGTTSTVELLYRNRLLGQVTLPFLSRDEFLDGLRLQMPTLFAHIGEENVACQTFVMSQCKGLLASGLLVSPTSLVATLDLDLSVEFRSERGGNVEPGAGPVERFADWQAGKPWLP